ncbi:MAG: hypothetical protein KC619_01190, partial [Myxococcales bacterium]|nr:hypothetical protein [Myxococcales bacterium]
MSRVNLTVRVVKTGPKVRLRYAFYAFEPIHKPTGVTLALQAFPAPKTHPDRTITQIVNGAPAASGTGKLSLVFHEGDFEVSDQYILVSAEVEVAPGGLIVNANAYYTPLGANGGAGTPAVYPSGSAVRFVSPMLNRQVQAIAGRRRELPRLVRALNDTPVREHPDAGRHDFAHPNAAAIAFAARWVKDRVSGGLAAAWAGEDQRIPGVTLELSDLDRAAQLFKLLKSTSPQEFRNTDGTLYDDEAMRRWVLDELWARLVAEMLCLSPYSGSGIFYVDIMAGKPWIGDEPVFDKASDSADPAYPLGVACQHLCTMALIARGMITNGKPVQQISAGSACAGKMVHLGGKWYAASDKPVDLPALAGPADAVPKLSASASLSKTKEALKIPDLAPGTIYLYSNHPAKPPPAVKSGRIGIDPGVDA